MATKLNTPIHREVRLLNPDGPEEDYIVTLKPEPEPS